MRGRLAVGDHDDLAGAALVAGEKALGEHEGVVHVRAQDRLVPAHVRQFLRLQFASVGGEADDVEAVPGELRVDQVVEREGDLLRSLEAAAQRHRPGEVQHDHGRRLGQRLGAVDLEVLLLELDGDARPAAEDAVHERLAEVEVEGIAKLVGFRIVGAFTAVALITLRVPALGRLLELGVDFAQRLLADLADATRR